MNTIFFYDTETTGFPLWSKPSSDSGQPHIVQAAGLLVNADTRKIVGSFDLTASPQGWDIPDEVAAIHGITTEYALEVGVPEKLVVSAIFSFALKACKRVGHNEPFDARIVRIALKRFGEPGEPDIWKNMPTGCTQKMATPILKLLPTAKMVAANRHHHKTANLREAYQHLTGKPLEDAHTAMADTLATMAVYFAIKDLEQPQDAPEAKTASSQGSGGDGVEFL